MRGHGFPILTVACREDYNLSNRYTNEPFWRHSLTRPFWQNRLEPVLQDIYRVETVCESRAAKLFRRLLEMVRSIMAPQLIHFQA